MTDTRPLPTMFGIKSVCVCVCARVVTFFFGGGELGLGFFGGMRVLMWIWAVGLQWLPDFVVPRFRVKGFRV